MVIANFKLNLCLTIGYVFKAFDRNKGVYVALKRSMKVGNIMSREYEMLSLLKNCPNIV